MNGIKFIAPPDQMGAQIVNVPGFEGDIFSVNFPECIGTSAKFLCFDVIKCGWQEIDNGDWTGRGWVDNELEYTIDVKIHSDNIDFIIRLTNKSAEVWNETQAFNCFNNGDAVSIRDHEGKRHWVRSDGEFKRLIEIPRVFGPRPALQLYSVEGAPEGKDIPFVSAFKSTPENVAIEGWMAIRSLDDTHMVAVVSKPALYTFQNREYSCIHSAPTFGPLNPGATGAAITRIYFVEASLEEWYMRMTQEFKTIEPKKL